MKDTGYNVNNTGRVKDKGGGIQDTIKWIIQDTGQVKNTRYNVNNTG